MKSRITFFESQGRLLIIKVKDYSLSNTFVNGYHDFGNLLFKYHLKISHMVRLL